MKTYIRIFGVVAAALFITSCEKEWTKYNTEKLDMNLFILAEADSTIRGFVMPVLNYFSEASNRHFDNLSSAINVTNAISASYSINDGEKMPLDKSSERLYIEFHTDATEISFRTQPGLTAGDKVSIYLSGIYYNPVSASVIIPDKPKVEYECMGIKQRDSSDFMQIKVKIKDNGEKKNYYKLNVGHIVKKRYEGYVMGELRYSTDGYAQIHTSFISENEIFKDNRVINKATDDYPDNFSNIFCDSIFNGKDYEFVIECSADCVPYEKIVSPNSDSYEIRTELMNYIEISLCEISEDYYNYCKLWEYADESAVILHFSNVDGGMGIFGALNGAKVKYNLLK